MWNQLLHRLHLARELSLPDLLALLEAWWWLLVFHWRLRWISFERLAQRTVPGVKTAGSGPGEPLVQTTVPELKNAELCHCEPLVQTTVPEVKNTELCHCERNEAISSRLSISSRISTAHRLNRLVSWASRLHLLSMTCLVQSLALRWMLSHRGFASDLKIGAMRTRTGIHAHAWLEVDGEVIGDAGVGKNGFSTLDSIE